MTPEELKAHRRAICEALIDGKRIQCCYTPGAEVLLWQDASAPEAAQRLFSNRSPELVRIKPESAPLPLLNLGNK